MIPAIGIFDNYIDRVPRVGGGDPKLKRSFQIPF